MIGHNSWGSGAGNFGIGCQKQGRVISINGNSGNVDFAKTVSLSSAGIT